MEPGQILVVEELLDLLIEDNVCDLGGNRRRSRPECWNRLAREQADCAPDARVLGDLLELGLERGLGDLRAVHGRCRRCDVARGRQSHEGSDRDENEQALHSRGMLPVATAMASSPARGPSAAGSRSVKIETS